MLVLSRKVGERILIGDQIAITVVRISGGGVRIGIEAPTQMAVVREELGAKSSAESLSSAGSSPIASGGSGPAAVAAQPQVTQFTIPADERKIIPAPRKAK